MAEFSFNHLHTFYPRGGLSSGDTKLTVIASQHNWAFSFLNTRTWPQFNRDSTILRNLSRLKLAHITTGEHKIPEISRLLLGGPEIKLNRGNWRVDLIYDLPPRGREVNYIYVFAASCLSRRPPLQVSWETLFYKGESRGYVP